MSVQIGEDIPIAWSYERADGAPFDPLEVRLYVWQPGAVAQSELIYGRDIEIVRASTGNYAAIVRGTGPGVLRYKTEGLGTADDPAYCKPGKDMAVRVLPTVFTMEAPTPGLNQLMYWGGASSIPSTEAQVQALANSALRVSFSATFTVTLASQYLAVSYPAAWGTARIRFVDGGGPIAMESTTFSVGGVSYRTSCSFASAMTFTGQIEVY